MAGQIHNILIAAGPYRGHDQFGNLPLIVFFHEAEHTDELIHSHKVTKAEAQGGLQDPAVESFFVGTEAQLSKNPNVVYPPDVNPIND
ncbi:MULTISPECIES: hypothetical protein [unclassified Paenibacillus]|uniref:hypothetical protein n=1 Tax=unclassified Paenibacillus TaxID=185978 RepID=UPI00164312C6|nr:hypothetical protein [Paenibacillus sp. Y412MC10]